MGNRITIGAILPTRAFAAAFVASGIVRKNNHPRSVGSDAGHYNYLISLPQNTPVFFLDGDLEKKGKLRGCQKINGINCLVVQLEDKRSTNLKQFVIPNQSHRIRVCPSETAFDELPNHQRGRRIGRLNEFTRNFLGTEAETRFDLQETSECLIIGQEKRLETEVTETRFGTTNDGNEQSGVLQDILRVKNYLTAARKSYIEIISTHKRKLPPAEKTLAPSTVIFDSADGYLKWRGEWRTAHRIVLLDRTETNFSAACDQLNQDFINRTNDETPTNFPACPAAVKAMYFEEKRR